MANYKEGRINSINAQLKSKWTALKITLKTFLKLIIASWIISGNNAKN